MTGQAESRRYVVGLRRGRRKRQRIVGRCPKEFDLVGLGTEDYEKLFHFFAGAFHAMPQYADSQRPEKIKEILCQENFLPNCSWILKEHASGRIVAAILVRLRALIPGLWEPPYVSMIAVAHENRGKGFGKLVLAKSLITCHSKEAACPISGRRARVAYAHILPDNIASIRTFESLGFRVIHPDAGP